MILAYLKLSRLQFLLILITLKDLSFTIKTSDSHRCYRQKGITFNPSHVLISKVKVIKVDNMVGKINFDAVFAQLLKVYNARKIEFK